MVFADGNIVSTAADLARFDIALLGGRLISPQTFALMRASPINTESAMSLQGLGIQMQSWRGLNLVGHHGGVPGFETQNELIPSADLAVVVLSDAFDFETPLANRVVLTALFPKLDTPAAGEDVAVTERFRAALTSLLRGEIDRSRYTAKVNADLTPALLAQTAEQMKPLGTVAKVTYLGKHAISGGTAYSYDVTFSGGQTMTWQFLLTPDGKVGRIGSSG